MRSALFVFALSLLFGSSLLSPSEARARRHRLLPAALVKNAPLSHQIVIADRLVMVINAGVGGQTPSERVDAINGRLVDIISSEPLLPDRMRTGWRGGRKVILVGAHLLTEVTPADARANHTSVANLARLWLANLKKTLPQARPVPHFK